jgi:hypothetical protein
MKAGWHTLVVQIRHGNTLLISGTSQPIGRPPQISSLPVCSKSHLKMYSPSPTCYPPVTDPTARIVRDDYVKGRVPQTPEEFASAFLASSASLENRADMDSYRKEFVGKPERAIAYRESATAEHATTSRKGSAYMISIPMQARAVMLRRLQILRGNMATQLIIFM